MLKNIYSIPYWRYSFVPKNHPYGRFSQGITMQNFNQKLSCVLNSLVFSIFLGILLTPFSVFGENKVSETEYTIGLGDTIEIHVWQEADLSRSVMVRLDGRVSLPLLGDVKVANKTISQLTIELDKLYGKIITEPAITVILTESKSRRYYILGQIQTPGEFPLDTPITVLQAIARSGGFLEWAKTGNISVIRRNKQEEVILKFDYDDVVKGKKLDQNIDIVPGDTIIVP